MEFDIVILQSNLIKEKSELMRAEAAWDAILLKIDEADEDGDWIDVWERAGNTYLRHLRSVKVLQHLLRRSG